MIKKHLFMAAGLLIIPTLRANAQLWIGVEAGYVKNYVQTNVGYHIATRYDPASGFSLAIPLHYAINDWLAVQTEAQFVQKNYRVTRTGFYEGIYQATTNQYLQLPVMGHFSFGGRSLKGFLNLGGFAGSWLTSHQQGVMPNLDNAQNLTDYNLLLDELPPLLYDEPNRFDSRKDRRFDYGWLAGAGISYQRSRYQFHAEGRYNQSLLDMQKAYMINQIPRYNQTYTLQVSVLCRLNRQHKSRKN